jgi:hypothetical protein
MRVCQSLTIFGFSGSVDNARFSVAGDVRAINLNEWNADLNRRAPIVAAMVFVIDSLGYVVQSVAKLNYDSLARDVAGFRNGQEPTTFLPNTCSRGPCEVALPISTYTCCGRVNHCSVKAKITATLLPPLL